MELMMYLFVLDSQTVMIVLVSTTFLMLSDLSSAIYMFLIIIIKLIVFSV